MASEEFRVRRIGVVRTPITHVDDAPKQGYDAEVEGVLEVDEAYVEGLEGIEPGENIILLCWMHRADREVLRVHPRGDATRPMRGVFSTRSQHRPNPIGIEIVEVLSVDGTRIRVRGLDVLDGTPILDIKKPLHPARSL